MKKSTLLMLDKEFILYCEINNIIDIEKLAKETFSKGFSLLKYPDTPLSNNKERIVIKEVPVEKIVIKEIIKEILVERIVEVIKEVPVEIKGKTRVITKEVPVERIVEVINTEEIEKLQKENKVLKDELSKITQSLEKLNRGTYMKNSDMGSLYDE